MLWELWETRAQNISAKRTAFWVRSQNFEKRLLGVSCRSVSSPFSPPELKKSAPTGRIFMKLDIWVFFRKSVQKIQVSLKLWQKQRVLYMKTNIYWYEDRYIFIWKQIYIYVKKNIYVYEDKYIFVWSQTYIYDHIILTSF